MNGPLNGRLVDRMTGPLFTLSAVDKAIPIADYPECRFRFVVNLHFLRAANRS